MPASGINPEDFFGDPARLTLERIIAAEYLLGRGVLPCELGNLPREQALRLLEEARRIASYRLGTGEFPVGAYRPIGFSFN